MSYINTVKDEHYLTGLEEELRIFVNRVWKEHQVPHYLSDEAELLLEKLAYANRPRVRPRYCPPQR